jgi:dipeptidyl aminopeptidase/acylaminoacyl peptidase
MRRSAFIVIALLSAVAQGCSSSPSEQGPGRLSFEEAQIYLATSTGGEAALDVLTVSKPQPRRVLGPPDGTWPLWPSPGRSHVLVWTNWDRMAVLNRANERIAEFPYRPFVGWAGDDQLVFYEMNQLVVFDVNGQKLREVTPPGASVGGAVISPDSKRIAVLTNSSVPPQPVSGTRVLSLADGSVLAEIPADPTMPGTLSVFWGEDGSLMWIDVAFPIPAQPWKVWSIGPDLQPGADGRAREQTLPFAPCRITRWAQSDVVLVGETVVNGDAVSCAQRLWTMHTDGTQSEPLWISAQASTYGALLALSPDAKRVAYLVDGASLYIAEPDGSGAQRLEEAGFLNDGLLNALEW